MTRKRPVSAGLVLVVLATSAVPVPKGLAQDRPASSPGAPDRAGELERALAEPGSGADARGESRESPATAGAPSPLDEALAGLPPAGRGPPAGGDLWSQALGQTRLRLVDISVDLLVGAGSSSERDEELQALQGGGHDPRKRGFTLQNLELSLTGAVDPFFTAEVHLIYFVEPLEGESRFELEEAFVTTLALPLELHEHGFQLEAGHFQTEFGRINPRHPHEWDWVDQPVINTRLFGPDGLRSPGWRLGWLTPLPWFSEAHVGMQNASGETLASFLASEEVFEERPVGGRPFTDRDVRSFEDFLYLARWLNSWDIGEEISTALGGSALLGPNATGEDGRTLIYGADLVLKWRPLDNDRGWPFVTVQAEITRRDYKASGFSDGTTTLPGRTLRDWGFYVQVLHGFLRNWAGGLRYEIATGSGSSVGDFTRRGEDPFRDDRQRLSPIVVWTPTEFSRVRLQYNWDRADHLSTREAHSAWISLEMAFGAHPAHGY